MSLERRKPATDKVASFLNIEQLSGEFDFQEDSPNPCELQVRRLRRRWPNLSLPLARAVAELAFGRAAI